MQSCVVGDEWSVVLRVPADASLDQVASLRQLVTQLLNKMAADLGAEGCLARQACIEIGSVGPAA